MNTKLRQRALALAVVLLVPGAVQAQEPERGQGANSLFIGHSFFVPVAASFHRIAEASGIPGHEMAFVFAGGVQGTPGALWENESRRAEIVAYLETGKIEVFGMTAGSADIGGPEAYTRWIELALQHNPDTRIFIGVPWVPGGPRMATEQFAGAVEMAGDRTFEVVSQLRSRFPDTRIDYLNYGKVASLMKEMFDAGELEDITELTASTGREGGPRDVLFLDGMMGHGGPMMIELSALVWLHTLYGADLEGLVYRDWNGDDVHQITNAVIEFNQPYVAR